MKRQVWHKVACYVLNTVASAEIDARQRTHYLAVLIAEGGTANTQHFVDNGAYETGKMLSHMKNSSERSDFLRFYAYLYHAIEDFACLETQH